MTPVEFAMEVSSLPAEAQNEFFESIKEFLSQDEYLETVKYISLTGLFRSPAKYKALRSAIYQTLFGIEIPLDVRTQFE